VFKVGLHTKNGIKWTYHMDSHGTWKTNGMNDVDMDQYLLIPFLGE
jgi:hypothetical protein